MSLSFKSLDQVCEVILGQSPPGATYNSDGEGIPFFQGKAEFGDLYPEVRRWCTAPSKLADKDDVLVSVRAPVGPTNLAPTTACIGRGLAALRPKNGIPARYILYALRATVMELAKHATGSTFEAISGAQLRAHRIPTTSSKNAVLVVAQIEEQFSRLDAGIAALKRAQANLKRYRASVLKAACEGRLVPTEAALARQESRDYETGEQLLARILEERRLYGSGKGKDKEPSTPDTTNLQQVSEGWTWATIEQLTSLVQYGTSAKTSEGGAVPVLRMGNIRDGKLDVVRLKYLSATHHEFPGLLLTNGDLLFNRTNSAELVGKSAVYKGNPSPCSFASYLIRVRCRNGLYPEFLNTVLNSAYGRDWVASVVSQQVGQANVNASKLQALKIPLPPLAEQERIVAEVERRLSITNQLESTIAANLTRAERLRQNVLQRAFTSTGAPDAFPD